MENVSEVSIVMASYNYEDYIQDAIESVLSQSYPNWELIIVDDGSKDNSLNIINEYCKKDSRIKLIQHENAVNKGLKDTLLLGISNAKNEWISFLESDDIYNVDYLEKKVKKVNSDSKIGLVFNDVEFIGNQEEINGFSDYVNVRQSIIDKKNINIEELLKVNLVTTFSCVMIKKELFNLCDFNSPLPQSLDYYLWTQLYKKTIFGYISESLTKWRKHGNNYMNKAVFKNQSEFDTAILKNLAGDNANSLLLAIYNFTRLRFIEKLFRPQVNKINKLIYRFLLKNEIINLA